MTSVSPSKRPIESPSELPVAAAQDFDPDDEGGGENPDQAPLAIDGDPKTAWETKTYFDGPVLVPYLTAYNNLSFKRG